jgi:protein-L-isoaspartate(D-aspartate) O-methyltransferase
VDLDAARAGMVARLQEQGYLRDLRVADAMRRVPRHLFLPGLEREAYRDSPLGIGQGQTISAPHMVALMAEALDAHAGLKVLEVGAGSGYHAAVVAELVQPGKVWSVERFPELAARARENLRRAGYQEDRVEVVLGDGSLGWPAEAPYDRAYLTCAAPALPQPILEQVRRGGKVLAPIGDRTGQELVLAEKTERGLLTADLGPCVFVPLVGEHGFAPAPST